MTTLAEYRRSVRRALGDEQNRSGAWTDDLVDAGLRAGLLVYAQAVPFAEAELTVTAAGRTQDLTSVDADMLTVVSVAWPWSAELLYTAQQADFEPVGHGIVRIGSGVPQAGDLIRFRYARRYRIAGLDDAAATTVPAAHADMVVLASASRACAVRIRQLSARPSAPKQEVPQLVELRDYLAHEAEAALAMLSGGGDLIWAEVGL